MFISEKVAALETELATLRPKVAQLERSCQVATNEVNSLQEQLEAKSLSLDEAMKELDLLRKMHDSHDSETNNKQRHIEELNIQVGRLSENIVDFAPSLL